jgi:GxxExxY protein
MHEKSAMTEGTLIHSSLTREIIGSAIEVHKELGPGLPESACEECLSHEFNIRGLKFQRQLIVPVTYKGTALDCSYRIDLLVENSVIIELKSIECILPIHGAQLITYMKLLHKAAGLLINFNVPLLKQGILRKVL